MKTTAGKKLKHYFSLVKFSHTIFALPFALAGFFLASSQGGQEFSIRTLIFVVLCMVFARSAAMSFNRYADHRYDEMNPRTKNREIPSGIISRREALSIVIISSVLFIFTTSMINRLTFILSPVALTIILGYSFTKRFTSLCHFILGLGLSLAPIGAYISVTGRFDILPLIYSGIVLTWVGGFDIIYSLQDDEFDKKHNLFSLPALTGRRKSLRLSVLSHVMTTILVIAAGLAGNGSYLFWVGALIFTGLLVLQHSIVRHDDLSRVTLAFSTTNGAAGLIFALFVILDLYLK